MIANASPHPHSPARQPSGTCAKWSCLVGKSTARPDYTVRLSTTPTAAASMMLNSAFSEALNYRCPHQNEDEVGQIELIEQSC